MKKLIEWNCSCINNHDFCKKLDVGRKFCSECVCKYNILYLRDQNRLILSTSHHSLESPFSNCKYMRGYLISSFPNIKFHCSLGINRKSLKLNFEGLQTRFILNWSCGVVEIDLISEIQYSWLVHKLNAM